MDQKITNQEVRTDRILQILLDEYERASRLVNDTDNRMLQFLAAGSALFALGSSYISNNPSNWSIEFAWITPLLFILFFGFILYIYYNAVASVWTCRVLSARINTILPESALIRYEPDLPESMFFSPRRGNPKRRVLYFLLIGSVAILFIFVLFYCGRTIYQNSHLAGNIFSLLYIVMVTVELVSLEGIFVDLPNIYQKYIDQMHTSHQTVWCQR